jgi:exopolysaccharide biosynthesis WecB/TagA/CpsF family protein
MFRNFRAPSDSLPPAAAANPWRARLDWGRPTRLFGLELVNARRGAMAAELAAMAQAGECATVQFINAHCINSLDDPAYRAALTAADLLLPDGSGLKLAARLAGQPMGDNLNGTDLLPDLCHHAARRGQSVFFLGGRPGVAAAAARAMAVAHPQLRIAGTANGYFDRALDDAMIDRINASGAAILLVGFGVPLQETWIAEVRHRLNARIVMGVGGLFDYYSGAVARAPLAFRAVGCEWVWRLLQEPRRLFRRYVIGNPLFVARALGHAWAARGLDRAASLAGKRAFDLLAAGVALLVLAPILAAVALAIRLEDGGPVFFRQTRIGAGGRPFSMWKFRSMHVDAEARLAAIRALSDRDGTSFKMRDDPRVTRVGRLLRRLSIDELPQLINIVAGDMTVVGPRPALVREVLDYAPAQRRRLAGRPGLTCTWQVSGRAEIPFARQAELDIAYLERRSFLTDLKLILLTVPAVLTARGAY